MSRRRRMVAAWSAFSEGPGPRELRCARPVASAATESFFEAMAADATPLALTDSVRCRAAVTGHGRSTSSQMVLYFRLTRIADTITMPSR